MSDTIRISCPCCGYRGHGGKPFALDGERPMETREPATLAKRLNFVRCTSCGEWSMLKRTPEGLWYLEQTEESKLFGEQIKLQPLVANYSAGRSHAHPVSDGLALAVVARE